MQKRKLKTSELDLLWSNLSKKFAEMNFTERGLEEKLEKTFSMAKTLNDACGALNVLDGMLICIAEDTDDVDLKTAINGIRLYLGEVIKEMENPCEL